MLQRTICFLSLVLWGAAANAQWDSVTGTVATIGETNEHWFSVRGRDTAFLIDGDAGEVKGTLVLSRFSPAIRPHMAVNRIYSYGSYYSRGYYGDREDVVLIFDASTTEPVGEIPLPPRSAGIGHSGMISLLKDTYLGVWNISPATSFSVTNIRTNEFVTEIATPGCAMIYAIEDGFIMPCSDGSIQYIELTDAGEETERTRSEVFFNTLEDPVFDYAVPAGDGWLFLSLEGQVFEVTVSNGRVLVSEPWSINPPSDGEADINGVKRTNDDDWRISGRQPFAYNHETGYLMTIMHQGGGQETFEDPGTEIWGFNIRTQRRGYRLAAEEGEDFSSVQLTPDADPLMIVTGSEGVGIYHPQSGKKLREVNISGGLIQNLYE
ncbi:MAG: hypothetical protein RLZZ385_2727 [Pseudomonadota bacterium]|jgi:methylamine dehydrogenase heavy chain